VAVVLAAASLLLTGCKIENASGSADGGSGPSATSSQGPAAGPSRSGPLITEPAAGFSPVYQMIRHARRSVDVTMYEFADTTAEHALAAAARRGVRVRVLLDQREKHVNSATFSYLAAHRVRVAWSSTRFRYTHQKTVVTDDSRAIIMTANLTSRYYADTRDFLVVDDSPADVSAIEKVFSADFAGRPVRPGDGRDLVWSPTGSQRQLLALISGARHSLRIYSEEMADTTVDDALISAARRGVRVRVCAENIDGAYDSAFTRLTSAGVRISYFSSSHGFYIHGKVIEADYGTRRARAFIGSENFSSTSLNDNRELGLITSNHKVLSSLARTFAADFRAGKRWQ
jgi:phosphatidylserine/phosphatidylglycerophosphate/cardiolipin synthase-like enzyme